MSDEKTDHMVDQSLDETDRNITQMGYFRWRPRFLQVLNRPELFTILLALGNLCTIMMFCGLSVIIPTLESVFNLNSKETGFILMAKDISGMAASILLAGYCSARKTKWIGLGMFIVFIAAAIPASSTIFAEYPQFKINGDTKLANIPVSNDKHWGRCNETFEDASTEKAEEDYAVRNHKFYWSFIVGFLLYGVGSVIPMIAGIPYMDEIFLQKAFGIATSFLYLVWYMGMPVSLMIGSVYLRYYVSLDPPPGLTIKDKEWVGAWWMGLFNPSVAILAISFFIGLFPQRMPASKKVLQEKIANGITTANEKQKELGQSIKAITKDMIPTYRRMLKNKALACLYLGDVFDFLSYGSMDFTPKIYSMIFRLTPQDAASILGIGNFIGMGMGLIAGGILMRAKTWNPKKLHLICCIMKTISIPILFLYLIYCPNDSYAGVDKHYSTDIEQLGSPKLLSECNKDCSCTTAFYQPVCDNGVTYFSPCHAGCLDVELSDPASDNNTVHRYTNCACAVSRTTTPGTCQGPCLNRLILNMSGRAAAGILATLGIAANAVVYQRIVPEADRTSALGLKHFAVSLFGSIPSPLIFGLILDKTCSVWRVSSDGTVGNCWLYDLDKLLLAFTLFQVALKALSTLFFWLTWWWFPRQPNQSTNPKENYEPEMQSDPAVKIR